jgi:hypothetical protein
MLQHNLFVYLTTPFLPMTPAMAQQAALVHLHIRCPMISMGYSESQLHKPRDSNDLYFKCTNADLLPLTRDLVARRQPQAA